MNLKQLNEVSSSEASFVLKNFMPIPKNAVTLLSATGGTGKTRLSLVMADRFVRDTGKKVALWLTEDYPGQVRHTFDEMVKAGITHNESMAFIKLILNEPPQLAKRENGIFKANYEEIQKIGEGLIAHEIEFAVFDPLLAFYGGNENDNSEARVFIQAFAEWAKRAKVTTLIIHHANKDGASRGATAFHDGVRARYELSYPQNNDKTDEALVKKGIRTVTIKKDNWGVRKYLWTLTNGSDVLNIKVMPELDYIKTFEVEEVVFDMEKDFKLCVK
jgi:replicative DNA helicase